MSAWRPSQGRRGYAQVASPPPGVDSSPRRGWLGCTCPEGQGTSRSDLELRTWTLLPKSGLHLRNPLGELAISRQTGPQPPDLDTCRRPAAKAASGSIRIGLAMVDSLYEELAHVKLN